jgi:hypothetical protein
MRDNWMAARLFSTTTWSTTSQSMCRKLIPEYFGNQRINNVEHYNQPIYFTLIATSHRTTRCPAFAGTEDPVAEPMATVCLRRCLREWTFKKIQTVLKRNIDGVEGHEGIIENELPKRMETVSKCTKELSNRGNQARTWALVKWGEKYIQE